MKKLTRMFVCGLLILATLFMSSAVYAAPNASVSQNDRTKFLEKNNKTKIQMDNAIKTLQPYVSRKSDGTFVLAAPEKVTASLDPAIYCSINNGMAIVNEKIKQGVLETDSKLNVFAKHAKYSIQELNGIYYYWWGYRVYINEYWTRQLIKGLATGAGATWVAAELCAMGIFSAPADIPLGLVAAILATGAAALDWIDEGYGIYISYFWNGTPYYVGAQSS